MDAHWVCQADIVVFFGVNVQEIVESKQLVLVQLEEAPSHIDVEQWHDVSWLIDL